MWQFTKQFWDRALVYLKDVRSFLSKLSNFIKIVASFWSFYDLSFLLESMVKLT